MCCPFLYLTVPYQIEGLLNKELGAKMMTHDPLEEVMR